MKIFHISDLHLGLRLFGYSLMEDQRAILEQILCLAEKERPDAMIIAGDVFDKPAPPAEAVSMFDDFLTDFARNEIPVLAVPGNHDSPERLSFGSRLMEGSGVTIAKPYDGHISPVTISDEYGEVDFWLLPFVRPADVRGNLGIEDITDSDRAVRAAVEAMKIDPARRNVLAAHLFTAGAKTCDSETAVIGGSDIVGVSAFEPFCYTALGHIHSPQSPAERVRYCGSPMKYSLSELEQQKSVTVAEIGGDGGLTLSELPLVPPRELRVLRGGYEELTDKRVYDGTAVEDYLHIVLTDEDERPFAVEALRSIYPNIMKLTYDNTRTRAAADPGELPQIEKGISTYDLFAGLYKRQNGRDMSDEQADYLKSLIIRAEGGGNG